jgi:mRNA-degrading endonuclease RelE of RelBE toxin-antitoxin system
MATTHVFIVDSTTFKYHLEYMFAGTGAKDNVIDFNKAQSTRLHSKTENNLVEMIADSQRVRVGDFVIFYLQQNFQRGIREGKFYGVFRVREALSFLDNNDDQQFLRQQLGKSLTFRTIIEPYQVYAEGVTEWEALDKIRNIQSPNQMLWSLIYRKLKGNRGNTMITIYESERLINLIRSKNNRKILKGNNFTFNENTQQIETKQQAHQYSGRKETINILPRLVNKYCNGKQFETHLQAYILQNIENLPMFTNQPIEWIGNEVSCGVGMQRIDIMLSLNTQNRKVIPIELKSDVAKPDIIIQLQRYVDWIEQYYLPNRPSDLEPMIIAREIQKKIKKDGKLTKKYEELITSFNSFNKNNSIIPLRYIEFNIDCNNETINFNEIRYKK